MEKNSLLPWIQDGFAELVWVAPGNPHSRMCFESLPLDSKRWLPWGPTASEPRWVTEGKGRRLWLWHPHVHGPESGPEGLAPQLRPGDRVALLVPEDKGLAARWHHAFLRVGLTVLGRRSISLPAPQGKGWHTRLVAVYGSAVAWGHRPSLAVVVPVHNGADRIVPFLERFRPPPGTATELCFVEWGSSDDSWGALERARRKYLGTFPIRLVRSAARHRAAAVRDGLVLCGSELVAVVGVHGAVPPEQVGRAYARFLEGGADVLVGDRFRLQAREFSFAAWGARLRSAALGFALGLRGFDFGGDLWMMAREDYQVLARWRRRRGAEVTWWERDFFLASRELHWKVEGYPVPPVFRGDVHPWSPHQWAKQILLGLRVRRAFTPP